MKQVLQHVKDVLERSFDDPKSHDLDHCINELEQAKETAGEKATMFDNIINAVTHAKHAQTQLISAGDISATNAFAEAHRAIDQAIDSYESRDNDPL